MKPKYLTGPLAGFSALLLCMACEPSVTVHHLNNNEARLHFAANRDYLLLPVEDGAPNATLRFFTEDGGSRSIRVALAREACDCTFPFDLRPYDGRKVVCEVTDCPYDAVCWEAMRLSDRIPAFAEEPFRPAYHHTPPYGWMNDPNGMVREGDVYHLFYQHNPYGSRWENMSWGHAVSRNLLDWEELGVVLEPDSLGAVFSGCCVMDPQNTAGFGRNAMIALYTASGARQTQCLAYSTDRGRTFTRYDGNPVLTSDRPDFRDPKVFYHDRTGRWIMVIAAGQAMEIHSSANLRSWRFESRFGEEYGAHGGAWECPDLFELPVEGEPGQTRWVMLCSLGVEDGSRVQYFVGDFDGRNFTPEDDPDEVKWMDFGRDHYATVTWSGAPDGRRIALGWMNNWAYANEVPSVTFRGSNTLPRELGLRRVGGELLLTSVPAREAEKLLDEPFAVPAFAVETEHNVSPLPSGPAPAGRIELELEGGDAEVFGCKLFNCRGEYVDICFNRIEGTMLVDRSHSGRTDFSPAFAATRPVPFASSGRSRLTFWIDRSSIELFVDGGERAATNLIYPSEPYDRMNFYAKGGTLHVKKLEISPLHPYKQKDSHE